MILTTGTFLKGLVHIGLRNYNAGRAGDFAAMGLSDHLARSASESGGSRPEPARASTRRTIDYSALEVQPGDEPPPPFSFRTERIAQAADPLPSDLHQRAARTRSFAAESIARRCTPG